MNILVLSPHPDDASIGCGGTILRHVERGDTVQILYLTNGEKGIPDMLPTEADQIRMKEAKEECKILGAKPIFWYIPDGEVESSSDMFARLNKHIVDNVIDVVYGTSIFDAHPDHREVGHLLAGITVRERYIYEVWTPLVFPGTIVDITSYTSLKRQAIRAHKSQLVNGFDEAILALNRYRGIMNGQNAMYAEAFS